MGDYVELANSYYRLLRWVEAADVEKKNVALRSLDRIRRFLDESEVEVIDLTLQPFSEGWAVRVLKMDDTVPENELVFTKMVKPIIQIKGEMVQEGEVYVGKHDADIVSIDQEAESKTETVETEQNQPVSDIEQSIDAKAWMKKFTERIKDCHLSAKQWTIVACGVVSLLLIILVSCCLGGQSGLHTEIATVDKKIEELSIADYRNQLEESHIVTVELRNGDNTIIVTQPIGEAVKSTVDLNGNPLTITTMNNNVQTEGE